MSGEGGVLPIGVTNRSQDAQASRNQAQPAPGFERQLQSARANSSISPYRGGSFVSQQSALALLGGFGNPDPFGGGGSGGLFGDSGGLGGLFGGGLFGGGLGGGGLDGTGGLLGILGMLGGLGGFGGMGGAQAPPSPYGYGPYSVNPYGYGGQAGYSPYATGYDPYGSPMLLQQLLYAIQQLIGLIQRDLGPPSVDAGLDTPIAAAAAPNGGLAPPLQPGRYEELVSTPMALSDFPRPANDSGRGIHWIPTTTQDQEVVDRFIGEVEEMGVDWVVFLNDQTEIGENDYLMKRLGEAGIEPIMRIYTPDGIPIQGDLGALVRDAGAKGVKYFQLHNEPNLKGENQGEDPDPARYVDMWLSAAKTVIENGGLPGFGALAPGGDFDDVEFLKQAVDMVRRRGEDRVFNRTWIAIHNYTLGRPLDYMNDANGFRKFEFYDQVMREKLGRSIPIVGTEGGTHIDWHAPPEARQIDEALQTQRVVDAYRHMATQREPYNFAYTYWVIANQEGGGHDEDFEQQALFQPGYVSPIVGRLKDLTRAGVNA